MIKLTWVKLEADEKSHKLFTVSDTNSELQRSNEGIRVWPFLGFSFHVFSLHFYVRKRTNITALNILSC